jgi:hypothetical protein
MFGVFRRNRPGKDPLEYRQGYCKPCMKQVKQNELAEIKAYVAKLVHEGACLDCGEDDDRCLVWHHRDPATKVRKIGECRCWSHLHEELAKCDLLCANCHMKRHA